MAAMANAESTSRASKRRKVASWLRGGAWAITDQALFAGSNLVLTVVLARNLSASDYGAFVFAFSMILFVHGFHLALLSEPGVVLGAGRYAAMLPRYIATLLKGHAAFSVLAATVLGLIGIGMRLVGKGELAIAFFGAAASSPFVLGLWLVRRLAYVRRQQGWAASVGALYIVVLLASIFVFDLANTIFGAFMSLGIAAAVAFIALLFVIRPHFSRDDEVFSASAAWVEHVRYGRWAIATSLLAWVPENAYYLALPVNQSLGETATLRVVSSLALPITNATGAIALLILPRMSEAIAGGRIEELRSTVRWAGVTLAIGCLVYFFLVVGFGQWLIPKLFGPSYHATSNLLLLVGVLPFMVAGYTLFGHVLRAAELPRLVFVFSLASATITVAMGVPAAMKWGVVGALAGSVAASATAFMGMAITYYRFVVGRQAPAGYLGSRRVGL